MNEILNFMFNQYDNIVTVSFFAVVSVYVVLLLYKIMCYMKRKSYGNYQVNENAKQKNYNFKLRRSPRLKNKTI